MKNRERIKQARDLHRQGDLDKAERIYREVLAVNSEDPDANHLLGVVSYQKGEHATAFDFISKAIAVRYDHPESHNNLGMVYKGLGRNEDALGSFRKAIDLQPEYAEAYNNLGTLYKEAGNFGEAETAYNRAIQLQPEYINALNNLGNLCVERKEYDKALGLYSSALALNPDYPLSNFNLACALIPLGRLDEAEAALHMTLKEDSRHVAALNTLGRLSCFRFQFDKSIAAFNRSMEADPESEDSYIGLGNTYSSINRFRKATFYLEKAIAIAPNSVEALNSLSLVYKFIGKFEEALQCLEKAHQISPGNIGVLCNLASLYMAKGFFEKSASLCREALHLQTDSVQAYCQLAQVTDGKESGDLIDSLSVLLDLPTTTPPRRARLQFVLANLLEEQGKFAQSFSCLVEANLEIRSTFTYSLEYHEEMVKRICEVYDERALLQFSGKGHKSNMPIFIVGMPRSGSTLVEQILSSHPDVHGGGELSLLVEIVTDYLQLTCHDETIPADIALREEDILELGRIYTKELQLLAPEARRITNKMLGNFLHIGIISLILPNAKIVHCRRNPIDTCYSVYKKCFTRGHQYAYDLEDVGNYYLLYDQIMQHWKNVLPGRFLDIYCEDLVRNQEAETRRLLEYCDLEWHDGCMRFFENRRPVFTASSVQVRKPITDKSVGCWKKYEKGLQPLISILKPLIKE